MSTFLCRQVAGVTLPEAGDSFPAGTEAVVSGWGVTDAGGASDVLMAVDVHIDSDAGMIFESLASRYHNKKTFFRSLCHQNIALHEVLNHIKKNFQYT